MGARALMDASCKVSQIDSAEAVRTKICVGVQTTANVVQPRSKPNAVSSTGAQPAAAAGWPRSLEVLADLVPARKSQLVPAPPGQLA
mmetsp:Transcript_15377/g.27301  ORF Transcript_15377/g.27301 Transcript_15377/m.27301 type:complete len:87 (-) Transcript_15377:46-306(-)